MRRRSALALGTAIGAVLGVVVYDRYFRGRDRIDLYFEDGSMVSIHGDAREASLVLPHAREALRAAR